MTTTTTTTTIHGRGIDLTTNGTILQQQQLQDGIPFRLCDPDWVLGGTFIESIARAMQNFSISFTDPTSSMMTQENTGIEDGNPPQPEPPLTWVHQRRVQQHITPHQTLSLRRVEPQVQNHTLTNKHGFTRLQRNHQRVSSYYNRKLQHGYEEGWTDDENNDRGEYPENERVLVIYNSKWLGDENKNSIQDSEELAFVERWQHRLEL